MLNWRRKFANGFFLVGVLLSGWIPAIWVRQQAWDLSGNLNLELSWLLSLVRLCPGLAALGAVALAQGDLKEELGLKFGQAIYYLPAWLLLPGIGALAAAISVLSGLSSWDWQMNNVRQALSFHLSPSSFWFLHPLPSWMVGVFFVVFHPLLCFLPACLEEIGWRGYAFHFLKTYGFWPTVMGTTLLWWAWQFPWLQQGYPYFEHPYLGSLVALGFGLGITILLTWLRKASRGIVAPAIARATLYGAALLPLSFTENFDPLWTHLQGIVGVGLLLLFVLAGGLLGLFRNLER